MIFGSIYIIGIYAYFIHMKMKIYKLNLKYLKNKYWFINVQFEIHYDILMIPIYDLSSKNKNSSVTQQKQLL